MIIIEKFNIKKDNKLTEYENHNTQCRKLITQMINMKNKLFLDHQITGNGVYLIDSDIFYLLDSNPQLNWYNSKDQVVIENISYYYVGNIRGSEIYYKYNLNNKIYYGTSINDIHQHQKRKVRKKKIEKINRL